MPTDNELITMLRTMDEQIGRLGPKRGGWILFVGLAAVLLPPAERKVQTGPGRYLMPLVPVMFVGIGCLVSAVGRWLTSARFRPLSGRASRANHGRTRPQSPDAFGPVLRGIRR